MSADVTPEVLEDLAPTGVLRAGINFGNPALAQRDAATGDPRGVSIDLARELGRYTIGRSAQASTSDDRRSTGRHIRILRRLSRAVIEAACQQIKRRR